jgi:uncharacterized protein YbgA (DUF1722 family)/uncharacterized protein YbbK (DUF523 family)
VKKVRSAKPENNPIKVGVSACLLGEKVRWDAGHKKDRYLTDILGRYFRLVPFCPEVELGMGVPRESVRLVGDVSAPRMVGNKTGEDWTERMNDFIRKRLKQIDRYDLSGYVLKKNSPSCGMERVRVYNKSGIPVKRGRGFFGGALMDRFENLPTEEEGRLNDHALRENFIVRVFAYHNLKNLFKGRFNRGKIAKFHTSYKYLLLSHSRKHFQELGRMMARIKDLASGEFRERYSRVFMEGLSVKSTIKKNTSVLQHIMGYVKKQLNPSAKRDILNVIEDYRKGHVPLVVPITLIRHYIDLFDVENIKGQVYLNPHPEELMLRNHV